MSSRIDFRSFAQTIAQEQGNMANLAVLEKELLHYEIIRALDKARYLDKLVFQGGTSLRLCYQSVRYSEDLDFVGGCGFDASLLPDLSRAIEKTIVDRYAVEVTVTEPKTTPDDSERGKRLPGSIDRWQIQVITQQGRPDIPQQKIKLEIAAVPAHTRIVKPLARNYETLPASYADILLFVEDLEEIAADKLFALVAAPYIRYRDIWDLRWISIQPSFSNARIGELLNHKIEDYRFFGDFKSDAMNFLDTLPNLVHGKEFLAFMQRFLTASIIESTLQRELFREHLVDRIRELYGYVL
jgi:predicted nucleotidyltransferase component of viral defense system